MVGEITENNMADMGTLTGDQFNQQQLSRQQKMAEMLMQQGMQQPQGQMVSGHYVAPSLFQNLAGLANIYMGQRGIEKAEKAQLDLADRLRKQTMQDVQGYGQAMRGMEATPDVIPQGQTLLDDQGQMTMGAQQGTAAVAPDPNRALGILMGSRSPQSQALAQALLADQMKTIVAPEGSTIYRGGIGGVGETIKGSPKKTSDIQNYEYDVANSGFKGTFNEWLTGQKKAGASNQIMNAGKDFTGQVGDIGKESRISAMGAVQTADAANRIIQAVDSNKLIAGVGADVRLAGAQLADALGLGGEGTTQKIANSRQAMQGLAQLTLQGRKQMRGEGAITQSEGELAQRAMSGDINFTKGEIRQLAEAAKRSAKFQYDMHQNIINTMRADPSTKALIPYFDVPTDTNIFNPRAVGGQSSVKDAADAIIRGQ
jgi:hypothetical protein